MSTEKKPRRTGRKIWYGTVIFLSALVILVSATGIVGSWVIGNTLSSAAVRLLAAVENTAGGVRNIVTRLDQDLSQIQETSDSIGSATGQISQNVTDKGLVLTLLPEEKEQALIDRAGELRDNLATVRNTLAAGFELYRSVDSLPFISLPKPDQESIGGLEKAIEEVSTAVQDLGAGVGEFRTNLSGKIDRVTGLVERVNDRLGEARQKLANLDAKLAALQESSARMQNSVPVLFGVISLILSLLFAFVLYTQVETIRLFVGRWRALGAPMVVEETASALPPASEVLVAETSKPEQVEPPTPEQLSGPGDDTDSQPEADEPG